MGKTIDDYEEEIDEELEDDAELRKELAELAKQGAWAAIRELIKQIVGSLIPPGILTALAELYSNFTDDGAD